MAAKNYVLMTLQWPSEKTPSLQDIAQRLNLPMDSFDADFDVVLVDEEKSVFCFQVDAEAVKDKDFPSDSTPDGPFSNPPIEPFWGE